MIKLTLNFECKDTEIALQFAQEAYDNFFYETYQDPKETNPKYPKMIDWIIAENGIEVFKMESPTIVPE